MNSGKYVLLIQFDHKDNSRTFFSFENNNEAMDGKLFLL